MPRSCLFLLLCLSVVAIADDTAYEFGGHGKARVVGQSYPDDSFLRDIAGSSSLDAAAELRLNFSVKRERWALHTDYQIVALDSEFLPAGVPDDARRLFDFTRSIADGADSEIVHRLDRFWVGFSGDKVVVRAGRQALSWGNGLFFAPMDLVNPFDPTTIDTEYKSGDALRAVPAR